MERRLSMLVEPPGLRRNELRSQEMALVFVDAMSRGFDTSHTLLELLRTSPSTGLDAAAARRDVEGRLYELAEARALSMLSQAELATLAWANEEHYSSGCFPENHDAEQAAWKWHFFEGYFANLPIAEQLSALIGDDEWDDEFFHYVGSHLTSAGRAVAVELLLAMGASAVAVNEDGLTPLHLLACGGDPERKRPLSWLEDQPVVGWSPRGEFGHRWFDGRLCVRLAKSLVACGADPEATCPHGNTPLLFAAYAGCREGIEALLAVHADTTVLDAVSGASVQEYAAMAGYWLSWGMGVPPAWVHDFRTQFIDLASLAPAAGGTRIERLPAWTGLPAWMRQFAREMHLDPTAAPHSREGLRQLHGRWAEAAARVAAARTVHWAVRGCAAVLEGACNPRANARDWRRLLISGRCDT